MSEEKVLALRGKKAVWAPGGGTGPIDPKRLPEGYPYKESNKTVIEWDGNTEGKTSVGDMAYKVSDAVLNNETIKNGRIYMHTNSDGVTETVVADVWDSARVTDEIVMVGEYAIFVRESNASFGDMTFPETGVYFPFLDGEFYTTKFISESETIYTMAPEFLPAGVGGGGMMVTVTGADPANLVIDKTFAEIAEAVKANKNVVLHWKDSSINNTYCHLCQFVDGEGVAFFTAAMSSDGPYASLFNFIIAPDSSVTFVDTKLALYGG